MILGHGIDIASIPRIAQSFEKFGDRFLERCYTAKEREYAESHKDVVTRLAGRFAAKEAVFKALGTGWKTGISWTDIEILPLPTGEPKLTLHGSAAQIAADRGITRWMISISHTAEYAVASAIGCSE